MKMSARVLLLSFPGRFGRHMISPTLPLPVRRWKSGGPTSRGHLIKSAPAAATVSPVNAATFRRVFEPAPRDSYKHLYRWDWHLRKLFYALIPPACAYAYVCFLEWYMADEVAAYREMVSSQKAAKNLDTVKEDAKTLEQRVMYIEAYLRLREEQREREVIVDKAKLVLKERRQAAAADKQKAVAAEVAVAVDAESMLKPN